MNALTPKDNNEVDSQALIRSPYNSEVFSAFVTWSSMTKKERQKEGLSTAKLFALKHGVQESQLSRWKAREDFMGLKYALLRNKMQELTPEVLDGFYRRCVRYGMAHDVELWLAVFEGWDRKRSSATPTASFGIDDIRTLLSFLPKEEADKYWVLLGELLVKVEQEQRKSLS